MAKRRPSGDGMVRKREDGRWEGRIVVGHKENGEPIFRYVLARTQKELLDKLHRDMELYQDAELTEESRLTLGEWLDRWMEDYGADTLRSYEQFIRCYIKPYLGDKIVSRVTRMDIQKLYRKLNHEGRVREHPEHGHELSDTMVLRIHAILHRCLKDAEADHVITRNPTDGAVVPKASYKPKQILTKEQIPQTLASWMTSAISNKFIFLLICNVFLIVVGMFIEGNASMIVLAPLLHPVAVAFGIDPVHFAMVYIFNCTIGAFTPPMGTLMFVTCGVTGCRTKDFIKEAKPFYLLFLIDMLVLTYFPPLTTFLVDLIY